MSVTVVGLIFALQNPETVRLHALRMRTRDGATLLAEVELPQGGRPYPALLERTIEPREAAMRKARAWAGRGYAMVVQECRGGTEGKVSVRDARDGYDAVEWVARQPWCDGRVGMMGTGYAGTTQWLAASETPPSLRGIAPRHGVFESLAGRSGLGPPRVPTLLLSDWGDPNRIGTMRAWEALRRQERKDVWLVYGPEASRSVGEKVTEDTTIRFFDAVLKAHPERMSRVPRVQAFLTGADRWLSLDGWPATTSTFQTLYLSPQSLRDVSGVDGSRRVLDETLFSGKPFSKTTRIAGPFEVRLFFRSRRRRTRLSASLLDIAPDGSAGAIGNRGKFESGNPKFEIQTALIRPWDAMRQMPKGHRLGLSIREESDSPPEVTILTGTITPSRITFRELE